jgi:hypothetical protein
MLAASASGMPDLKVTVRETSVGRKETVTYIQTDRKRTEEHARWAQSLWPRGLYVYIDAPHFVTITRCDLGQRFELNLDDREYTSMSLPKFPSKEELQARAAKRPNPTALAQPNLLIEMTTVDSGEHRQMFGYTARHVITTRKQIPLEGSRQDPTETVTDGWYIDLDTSVSCDPQRQSGGAVGFLLIGGIGEIPIPTFKNIGKPESGFALATKTTFRSTYTLPDGSKQESSSITETQVTELSARTIAAALFEVPPNFRQVSQVRRSPSIPFWKRWLIGGYSSWVRLKQTIKHLYNYKILSAIDLSEDGIDTKAVRMAALLQDIGHVP